MFGAGAVLVFGAEGFAFLDADAVGVAVGLVAESDFGKGEGSEAAWVVDLQDALLEWEFTNKGLAYDHRKGGVHLSGWVAQDGAEILRSPDLEEFVAHSSCRRKEEKVVHCVLNSVSLDFQIDVQITVIVAPLIKIV